MKTFSLRHSIEGHLYEGPDRISAVESINDI